MTQAEFINELAMIEVMAEGELSPRNMIELKDYTRLIARTCQPGGYEGAINIARGYVEWARAQIC